MRNPILTFVLGLVLGLVVAVGTFFTGQNMGQAQAQSAQSAFFQQRGFNPNGTGGGAGGTGAGAARNGATGTISKIDGSTITITTPNSGDTTVTLATSGTVSRFVSGTVSDLKVGDRVTVQGTRSGNNISATQITQVPPGAAFGGGGGRGGRNGTPTATP